MSFIERAAGLVVYRKVEGIIEYLLLQASYKPFHWTPPKGHVDPGEDEWTAAIRETEEEAGIKKEQLTIHEDCHETMSYNVPKRGDRSQMVPKTVKYWLAGVKDKNEVLLSHEHQNMKWSRLEEAVEVVKFPEMVHMSLTPQEQLGQILRAMILSQMERHLPEVELQCGESRGPFVIKELGAEASEGENQITLLDQLGQAHHFEVESRDPLLRRIKGVADARMANCVVTHSEDKIQLVVTKDIRREEDLLAAFLPQHLPSTAADDSEKKYPCLLCNNAKFSSSERLLAHQSIYCSKSAVASTSLAHPTVSPASILQSSTTLPAAPAVVATPSAVPNIPNVLLLPLAFHDQPQSDIVQLLGPPQTVLPVAVGRSALPLMQCPLLIQRNLCSAVTVPASLSYSIGNTPVAIPIASVDTPTTSVAQKRPIGPSPPLDLSKRARLETSPPVPLPKAGSSSEVEKPFVCSCGVAFSAESTLKAHQQYYCKDVERSEEPREPQRKIPSRCSQCQFEPQSQSQLSIHIRSCHNDVQAYVCKVCGYRGFSLRGIRSHMRSHPNLDYMKFDTLLATHVAQIKEETGDVDDLRYADVVVLIGRSLQAVQRMVTELELASRRVGLEINKRKTVAMTSAYKETATETTEENSHEAAKNVVEKNTIIGGLNAEQAAFEKQLQESKAKEANPPWIAASDETLVKKIILDPEEEDKTQDSEKTAIF